MNRLLLTGTLLLAVGCNQPTSEHGAAESHADHEAHDSHKGDAHEHAEHAEHAEHGKDDGHAEHGKDDGHAEHGKDDGHGEDDGHGHDKPPEHGDEENAVHVPVSSIDNGSIVLAKVIQGVLKDALEVPAEIQIPPDRLAHVSPLVDGQLLNVRVGIGEVIKAGQPLVTLRSVALGKARAALSRATTLQGLAKRTLDRQKKLRDEGISSERSYLDARAALDQADAERSAALSGLSVFGATGGSGPDMTLVSPIAGTVIERHATRGENVSPGDPLFVVADTSLVWVIGQAYERQISRVRPKMKATLTLTAYPSKSWQGQVSYIGAIVSEATRTLPIRVEIENDKGLLRPGLFGSLRLYPDRGGADGVLVPLTAIQTIKDGPVVFIPGDEAGEFRAQPVTLGRENKLQVEVLKGLVAGSSVVVQGGFILKSEMIRGQLGHGHAH